MSTPSNVSEFPFEPRMTAPAGMSVPRPLYWSVRRELWENRFVYIAPLIVAAVVLFASVVNTTMTLPARMRALPSLNAARQHTVLITPYSMAPAPIMLASFLIGFFYSLDALYGERRDRSILFFKSLPVSDVTTVLSKAVIPVVVLPVIAFALSVATLGLMLLQSTTLLVVNGISPARLWGEVPFIQLPMTMLYGLTVHVLWFAPIYAWLLLVSSWAKRTPLLWAVLPLMAVSAVEKIAFNTTYFMAMLQYRITGAMKEAFAVSGKNGHVDQIGQLEPGRFLTTAGLWAGLVFALACLAVATRLRRNREPI